MIDRNHDLVALSGFDEMVAAGAAVALECLVRLHMADLDGVVVARPHQIIAM